MIVKSNLKNYKVNFHDSFSFINKIISNINIFVIVDKNVFILYQTELEQLVNREEIYIIKSIEEKKTMEVALDISEKLMELPSKKNTVLVSIGGGIVQDITGFIASILYRGLHWIWIPTTLLAQLDSCIGSKTSLNYKNYKNLFGTFYPPDEIFICSKFVNTLKMKEYYSGLGEMIKFSIMQGEKSFCNIKNKLNRILDYDFELLNEEIENSLMFKKGFIEEDEFDKDIRNLLNYGHTFGHALESVSRYSIPHGQAVSIGMMIANQISLDRGYITKVYFDDIKETIKRICQKELIMEEYFDGNTLILAMKKDKKYTGGLHTCILLKESKVKKYKDVKNREISEALAEIKKYFFD